MLNDPIVTLEACRLCELSDSRQKAIFPDISANLVDRAFIAKMTVRRAGVRALLAVMASAVMLGGYAVQQSGHWGKARRAAAAL